MGSVLKANSCTTSSLQALGYTSIPLSGVCVLKVFFNYSFSQQYLYGTQARHLSYNDFINKELILFSNSDNERSIPSLVDGSYVHHISVSREGRVLLFLDRAVIQAETVTPCPVFVWRVHVLVVCVGRFKARPEEGAVHLLEEERQEGSESSTAGRLGCRDVRLPSRRGTVHQMFRVVITADVGCTF